VTAIEATMLLLGGLAAGIVNTLAGAGSLITVPLLVLVGLPGTVANGSNRIGVLLHNVVAAWRFRAEGLSGLRRALPLIAPVALGSILGAYAVSLLDDLAFERLFAVVMLLLLIPLLRTTTAATTAPAARSWSTAGTFAFFLLVGIYGGAFQAGVGIAILFGLSYAGHDLVRANSIKVVVNGAQTLFAVPVFILQHQIAWGAAAVLAIGFMAGGVLGVRLAVHGGERVIRPVLVAAVLALAGRMLGLY
jgi:uncharacterized membrane protein YfcA